MNQPSVSILMPSYNHAAFIAEAIESILDQSFPHLELIIVDDASQDDSPRIIHAYQERDKRIRSHFCSHNGGTAVALNKALDMARGHYVSIFTSDDTSPPQAIEHLWNASQQPHNRDKVIVGDWEDRDRQGKVLPNPNVGDTWEQFTLVRTGDIFESLLHSMITYISMQTLLVRRDQALCVRFDEDYPVYCMEFKYALDLASQYHFYKIDQVVFHHIIHGDNVTCHWDGMQELTEKARIAKDALNTYRHRIAPATITRLHEVIIHNALQNQKFAEARHYFLDYVSVNAALFDPLITLFQNGQAGDVQLPGTEKGKAGYRLNDIGVTLADVLKLRTQQGRHSGQP